MGLTLSLLPLRLAICRLGAEEALPGWLSQLPFWSATRTGEELSLVIPEDRLPAGWQAENGWRSLKVQGPLDFGLTGILASLSAPLAQAGVSLFALSTYDTDYLLVRETTLAEALSALRTAGFEIIEQQS